MNVAWVGDITEIQTWEGKLYLATVIDLYSRRLLGYAIEEHCKAPLVTDALRMAAVVRGGDIAGVEFHSDRGSQYTAKIFTACCQRLGVIQSMSRSGSCLDCRRRVVFRVVEDRVDPPHGARDEDPSTTRDRCVDRSLQPPTPPQPLRDAVADQLREHLPNPTDTVTSRVTRTLHDPRGSPIARRPQV